MRSAQEIFSNALEAVVRVEERDRLFAVKRLAEAPKSFTPVWFLHTRSCVSNFRPSLEGGCS